MSWGEIISHNGYQSTCFLLCERTSALLGRLSSTEDGRAEDSCDPICRPFIKNRVNDMHEGEGHVATDFCRKNGNPTLNWPLMLW